MDVILGFQQRVADAKRICSNYILIGIKECRPSRLNGMRNDDIG